MNTPIFPAVLHGGDYNPEQWPQATREEDIRLMGEAWYVATHPDAAGLNHLLSTLCAAKGIGSPLKDGAPPPEGVEVQVRVALLYVLNYGAETTVPLAEGNWHDLLTGETLTGNAPLPVMGVRVLRQS